MLSAGDRPVAGAGGTLEGGDLERQRRLAQRRGGGRWPGPGPRRERPAGGVEQGGAEGDDRVAVGHRRLPVGVVAPGRHDHRHPGDGPVQRVGVVDSGLPASDRARAHRPADQHEAGLAPQDVVDPHHQLADRRAPAEVGEEVADRAVEAGPQGVGRGAVQGQVGEPAGRLGVAHELGGGRPHGVGVPPVVALGRGEVAGDADGADRPLQLDDELAGPPGPPAAHRARSSSPFYVGSPARVRGPAIESEIRRGQSAIDRR